MMMGDGVRGAVQGRVNGVGATPGIHMSSTNMASTGVRGGARLTAFGFPQMPASPPQSAFVPPPSSVQYPPGGSISTQSSNAISGPGPASSSSLRVHKEATR